MEKKENPNKKQTIKIPKYYKQNLKQYYSKEQTIVTKHPNR